MSTAWRVEMYASLFEQNCNGVELRLWLWWWSRGLGESQSCMSAWAFRAGFGAKVDKISGLIRAWEVLFVLGAQKYNQNNLEITLTFFRPNLWTSVTGLRWNSHFQSVFGFGLIFLGLDLN